MGISGCALAVGEKCNGSDLLLAHKSKISDRNYFLDANHREVTQMLINGESAKRSLPQFSEPSDKNVSILHSISYFIYCKTGYKREKVFFTRINHIFWKNEYEKNIV